MQGAKPPDGARGILTLPGGQVIGGQVIGDPLFLLFPQGWVMMHYEHLDIMKMTT